MREARTEHPARTTVVRCLLAVGVLTGTFVACTRSEPTGTCYAVSRRSAKRDIAYLSAPDVKELADKALGVRLAHFRYKSEPSSRDPHLGFIVEDAGPIDAVDWPNGAVDLYAYTSLVLAATQAQNQDLVQLQSRVGKLERLVLAAVQIQEQKIAQLETHLRELEAEEGEGAGSGRLERRTPASAPPQHARAARRLLPQEVPPRYEREVQAPLLAGRSQN